MIRPSSSLNYRGRRASFLTGIAGNNRCCSEIFTRTPHASASWIVTTDMLSAQPSAICSSNGRSACRRWSDEYWQHNVRGSISRNCATLSESVLSARFFNRETTSSIMRCSSSLFIVGSPVWQMPADYLRPQHWLRRYRYAFQGAYPAKRVRRRYRKSVDVHRH